MKFLVICAFLAGVAAGQSARPLESVISDIVRDVDRDQDGMISSSEFAEEFLLPVTNGTRSSSRADFILFFTLNYGEDPKIAGEFFDNLDTFFPIGELNELDILMDYPAVDLDGDGTVSTNEFDIFLHKKHPHGRFYSTASPGSGNN